MYRTKDEVCKMDYLVCKNSHVKEWSSICIQLVESLSCIMYMYTYTHMQKFWHQRHEMSMFSGRISLSKLFCLIFFSGIHCTFVYLILYHLGSKSLVATPIKFISIPSLWLISGRYANLHWPLWSFDISRDIRHVRLQTKITIFWSTYSDVRWCHRVANSFILVNPVETVLPRP